MKFAPSRLKIYVVWCQSKRKKSLHFHHHGYQLHLDLSGGRVAFGNPAGIEILTVFSPHSTCATAFSARDLMIVPDPLQVVHARSMVKKPCCARTRPDPWQSGHCSGFPPSSAEPVLCSHHQDSTVGIFSLASFPLKASSKVMSSEIAYPIHAWGQIDCHAARHSWYRQTCLRKYRKKPSQSLLHHRRNLRRPYLWGHRHQTCHRLRVFEGLSKRRRPDWLL